MSSDSYGNLEATAGPQILCTTVESETLHLKRISSRAAVWRALAANLGIAGIKLICWFFSKSSAMLSEAIHSGVDSFNSLCLLVGLQRGSKPADDMHPYGYGLEANIWAMFACVLMLIGTFVSLYSGFHRLFYSHTEVFELLHNYHIIALTLVGSIFFEMWAVSGASLAVMKEADIKVSSRLKAFTKSFKHVRKIKSPTTKFVWYEDTAALLGVIVAFIALTISKFFVSENLAYLPDAIASIIIGLILLSLAIYLLKQNVNYLTGAAAGPHIEKNIREIVANSTGVSHLHELKTIDMGSSIIVNMTIEVDPETPMKDADDIADRLEEKIKSKIKHISHVTIEMQADETEDNWNEKFENLIAEGKQIGILKPNEANMLSKFFDFTETVVCEIMVPRPEVKFIEASAPINDLIDLITTSGHTRIPVYRESVDDLIGIVNAKDVLRLVKDNANPDIQIEDLVREIAIVPENKSISDMLTEFNKTKSQIAAVIDEHGGVAGIVTVEDVLEEIVGEIWDEFDVQIPEIIKIDENTINIISKMDIVDLNEKFNLDLPTEDFQTIGGYVFGLLGREPEVGDEIEGNGIHFKVDSVDGHKIVRVIMQRQDGFVDTQEETRNSEEG